MHRITTVSLRQLTSQEEIEHLGHLINSNKHELNSLSSTIEIQSIDNANESKKDPTTISSDTASLLSDDQLTCFSTVNVSYHIATIGVYNLSCIFVSMRYFILY